MKTKIFLLFFFFVIKLESQTVSNLGVVLNQIDSSITKINSGLTNINNIRVKYNSPPDLTFLQNHVYASFARNKSINDSAKVSVEYTLNEISVKYENPGREDFLGDFIADRLIELKGVYLVKDKNEIIETGNIFYSNKDRIPVDEIKNIQNSSLPFTQGKIPEEPFLTSLYEPLIAVSAIVVSVYLFFSVRSK
jgi:hypothetical protein